MIYFDSAATTLQKPREVAAAVARAIDSVTTPGRGDHPPARQAADIMLQLRTAAGELFGVSDPERVILTGNATHGLNIAIKSLVRPGNTVAVSGYEHNAVTRPLHAIGDVRVKVVNGRLFRPEEMVEGFHRAIRGGVDAVICTHVSNVFGYAMPIEEIAALCRETGGPLVVDASQSAGILPVDTEGWGAAFVAMPGHKGLYGPQGTGLLLCGAEHGARTLLEGGTGSLSRQQQMPDFLPDRLEAGTHNVHGAAGLLEGLRFVSRFAPGEIGAKEGAVMRVLARGLAQRGGYRVFACEKGEQSVLSVQPLHRSVEEVADHLAQRQVAVRAGLHCSPLAHMTVGTEQTGTLRFSASVFNTPEEAASILAIMP